MGKWERKAKGKGIKGEMGKRKTRNIGITLLSSFYPFICSYNVNSYNFAALSQVILRLSASGTPAKAFSTNSRECGKVEA
jgi:hypothetical protein